jgi:hypothetical protein
MITLLASKEGWQKVPNEENLIIMHNRVAGGFLPAPTPPGMQVRSAR